MLSRPTEQSPRSNAAPKPLPASLERVAELIGDTRWADGFSAREILTVAAYFHAYEAARDDAIIDEGAHDAHLCLIAKGRVRIVKTGADGEPRQIATSGAGRTFGEMSLVDGEPRSASVLADDSTVFLVLTRGSFEQLMDESPRLAIKILLKVAKLTSQRLRQTTAALVDHLVLRNENLPA